MAEIVVGYFLEDLSHESFITGIVRRVAAEVGLETKGVRHDVRSAAGGAGMMKRKAENFLRDVARDRERIFDVLVLAMDGDCHRYVERKGELEGLVARSEYPGEVVYAIPDPHIERWYVCDPAGLREAIGGAKTVELPKYDCKKGLYKQVLRDAFEGTGIIPPLGGTEYGDVISATIDFYRLGKCDAAFGHFVGELKGLFQRLRG